MSSSKHFKTAKENQTAPILNNASIYRAGQNPSNKPESDDEHETEMIKNSFYVPDRLHSQQQPTFVDALKRRRDHTGRIITKSRVINNPNRRPQRSKSESPPIYSTNEQSYSSPTNEANHVQFNNLSNYPCTVQYDKENNNNINTINQSKDNDHQNQMKADNEDESEDEDSSDSDSDFDMNNLTVPKVEPQNNGDTAIDLTTNIEADAVREKFKQKLKLQRQKELESQPQIVKTEDDEMINERKRYKDMDDDSEDDESDSSEYETASSSEEEEESMHPRRRKIRFMNEKQREQNAKSMKPSLDEQQEILEKMEEDRKEKLRERAAEDALEYVREQDKAEKEGEHSDEDMPDDNDDDPDGEEGKKEFEAWKLRELKRLKRDEELREERENERLELERRRKMTDEEIMRENKKLGLNKVKKKGSMKFMQKYFHQGVFYRDGDLVDDKLLDRDFNQATGQDKYIDFSKVPEAMKRKNFGKMSQSKWTHLANEDTTFTKEEREWFKKKRNMTEEERKKSDNNGYKFRHRAHQNNFWFNRGGSGSFDRPSYKKGNVNNSTNKRFERTEDDGYHDTKRRKRRDKDRDRDRDRNRRRRSRSKSPYRNSRRRR